MTIKSLQSSDKELIDIIIVNYFSSKCLEQSLASIKTNDCFANSIIHVIDNSNDSTELGLLKNLQEKHSFNLHSAQENLGFAKACNLVFSQTDCPYVLLINPDAYLLPNAIDRLLEKLISSPQIAATGPKIFWDDSCNFLLPRSAKYSPLSYCLNRISHPVAQRLLWFKSLLFRRGSLSFWRCKAPRLEKNLSGGSVLLKRELVQEAGGLFDPQFFMYFEDTDLFKRLTSLGHQLYYVPEAHVVHKFSGCARSEQERKNQYMADSEALFLRKHYKRSVFYKICNKLEFETPKGQFPRLKSLGTLSSPEAIMIPLKKSQHYLIEWSPSPFFLPAAGMEMENTTEFCFPQKIWDILPEGNQYLRISQAKHFWIKPDVYHWVKLGNNSG